jgi:hypothetical protein
LGEKRNDLAYLRATQHLDQIYGERKGMVWSRPRNTWTRCLGEKRYDLVYSAQGPATLGPDVWGEKRYDLVYSAQGPATLGPDVWGEKRYELVYSAQGPAALGPDIREENR